MHHDFDDEPVWEWTFRARDEEDTRRLGAALAEALPDGATLALCGTLGAGKTRLVQAITDACGIPREQVVSPTFILCHEYHGRRTIYHLDAYRLRDSDEFLALGVEEFLAGPGITLIEWADRVDDALPRERWKVDIVVTGETTRRFDFSCRSDQDRAAFELLVARCA
ncbi:MAG: tRNA (adenosine(37)-N6)-threonylcarbamoyltransferase complex ATPase subunit type 1 TsaE [Pirellulales bacterium]